MTLHLKSLLIDAGCVLVAALGLFLITSGLFA